MDKIKVLIAIDDPDWSNIIVQSAVNFIDRENSKIILLNVLETTLAEKEYFSHEPKKFIKYESRKEQFAYIENFLEKNHLEYTFIFEEGDSAEHIINTAHNLRVDLVVVGSHNKKLIERLILGSVAYKVMRLCSCPVMVVSSRYHVHNLSKKEFNILMAVDNSAHSLEAVSELASLIDTRRSRVYIANVRIPIQETLPPEAMVLLNCADKIEDEARRISMGIIDNACEILENIEFISIDKVSIVGRPATTILDFAEKNSIDLIVLGKPGSTTTKITERADIPVLVFRKNN